MTGRSRRVLAMHRYTARPPAYSAWSGLPQVRRSLDNARRAADRLGVRAGRPTHLRAAHAPPAQSPGRYLDLRTGLEWTRFGEALDRFDFCEVLRDALGCQMWVIEARSHDDSDALDRSGFHVVDAVRVRATIACQPYDRWRDRLNRHGAPSLCLRRAGSRGRVHPRVRGRRNGVHENPVLSTFNCKDAHQSDYCALGGRVGGLATHSEEADDRRREDDLPETLCDHMRPGSLHGVDRPAEVDAPVMIEIVKGGVLE